ncbi:hypothetical protein LCM20_03295 [Halobacillus litoralis]|uniref:hypothetical protein n=1 Tax=Halobacillus litoralis TaxID=45668 RepID=UPI001CD74649|nr:hypothetical protein [Halobacillus litoralis]MCA0969617.1 hypothetical protein [Halobacillus litoralis]
MIRWGIWIGTISGIVLGLFLWFVEMATGRKVYTLLMNVDFIPVIGDIEWPVYMEWLFHMIISWIIGILYVYILKHWIQDTRRNQWGLSILLTAFASTTYVPLTILAIKETPSLTDGVAILYWLIGHVLYAITLKKAYFRFW